MRKLANPLSESIVHQLVTEGKFEIDSCGRVWRLQRLYKGRMETSIWIPCDRRRADCGDSRKGVYLQVRTMHEGKRLFVGAHRLVWMHFHNNGKPAPEDMEVNHEDGIKDNNDTSNLTLMTRSDNHKHAHRIGLIDQRGQKNPAAKLADYQVAEIRNTYAKGGITQEELAKHYGVSFKTISKIVRGQRRASNAGIISDYTYRRQHNNVTRDSLGRFSL